MDERTLAQLKSDNPLERKKAIIALGNSKDREALKILGELYRSDPDPGVREAALRAGRYIQRETQTMPKLSTQELASSPSEPSEPPAQEVEPQPEGVDLRTLAEAQSQVKAAQEAGRKKDKPRAIIALTKAIRLNPGLAEDDNFRELASTILTRPPDEAIKMLLDPAFQQDVDKLTKQIEKREQEKRRTQVQARRSNAAIYAGVVMGVLVLVTVVCFVSGLMTTIFYTAKAFQVAASPQTLDDGTEYYLLVPEGGTPDDGWALVVALHGYEGSGADMLRPALVRKAYEEKAVVVAPSFFSDSSLLDFDFLDPFAFEDPNTRINRVVAQVKEDYPINDNGIIVYGFSLGAWQALQYFAQNSANVHAVIAEGTPFVPSPPAGTYFRPLYILYGENDSNKDYTQEQIQTLRNLGHTVIYEEVPGAGHQMTNQGINHVGEMIRDVHEGS
jgi:predicted esterase